MLQTRLGRSPPLPTPASNDPSPHETDKLCRVDLHERFHQLHFSPEAPLYAVVGGECQAFAIQRDLRGRKHKDFPPPICLPQGSPGTGELEGAAVAGCGAPASPP